jgi:hypothetical protein
MHVMCVQVQHGEQTYVKLANETHKSHDQLTNLEKHYKDALFNVTDYLHNQEDFELIHQRIMQRVHKEELQDLQAKTEEAAKAERLLEEQRIAEDQSLKAKVRFNLENLVS